MPELKSEFLFTIRVTVDRLHDVGETPFGTRHIDMLGDGSFKGPKLKGIVLEGMDQKIFRSDGAMNPNVRIILKTDDDALIYMYYTGIRYGSPEVMQRIADGETADPSNTIYGTHPISRRRSKNTIGSIASSRSASADACRITPNTTSFKYFKFY